MNLQFKNFKKLFFLTILFCGIFCLTKSSLAATFYVSPAGSGATCSSGSPCAAAYAMLHAVAGDTWLFQSGTYNVGSQSNNDYRAPILNPSNSGSAGNPIIFQSASQGDAIINGTPYNNGCNPIGSEGDDYITWDGFKVECSGGSAESTVYLSSSADHVTVKNCEIIGASLSNAGSNVAGIKLEGPTHATIQNNYIHGHQDPAGNHNTAGLWTEDTSNLLVTGNTFSNNTENIYSKYQSTNDTYALNYLDTLAAPGSSNANFFIQNYSGPIAGMSIYQNIIKGGSDSINIDVTQSPPTNSFSIYNNTLYGPSSAGIGWSDNSSAYATWSAWNNITAISGGVFLDWEYPQSNPVLLNYNDYFTLGGSPQWQARIYSTSCNASSLANWQSNCGYEANSVTTNPSFSNASGNFSLATDFKRNSYPTNGRGGSYSSVMGAYINGNEAIGYGASGGGGGDTTPPAAPSGLSVS